MASNPENVSIWWRHHEKSNERGFWLSTPKLLVYLSKFIFKLCEQIEVSMPLSKYYKMITLYRILIPSKITNLPVILAAMETIQNRAFVWFYVDLGIYFKNSITYYHHLLHTERIYSNIIPAFCAILPQEVWVINIFYFCGYLYSRK